MTDMDISWARQSVAACFADGLQSFLSEERVAKMIRRWQAQYDPIYEPLLRGLGGEERDRFLGYYLLGTVFTPACRLLMERAIRDLLWYQREHFGRPIDAIYTRGDLERGHHLGFPSLAFMGEERKEWQTGRGWSVRIRESAIAVIEDTLREEDRQLDELLTATEGDLRRLTDYDAHHGKAIEEMRDLLARSLDGEGPSRNVRLASNLIVVEPPPGKVLAIRFINLKNASRATAREERRNQLLLLAYCLQEKLFRRSEDCRVCLTGLFEWRHKFSTAWICRFGPHDLWAPKGFWAFVRVPYSAVEGGLEDAGGSIASQLGSALGATVDRAKGRPRLF